MADSQKPPEVVRHVTFQEPQRAYTPSDSFLSKLLGSKTAPNNKVSESLDYEPIQNKIFSERLKNKKEGKKKLWGYTGHTLAKFLITFFTGIITGMIAVAMSKSVGKIIEHKNDLLQSTLLDPGSHRVFVAFWQSWLIGSSMVIVAVAMVQYWAPASAGAGVTLVMAYLNGNHIPNLLSFSTLVTKFVGTVCAVSAGLPMGPEGPMVHIGACLASVITYAECKCLQDGKLLSCFGRKVRELNIREKLKVLDDIVSDSDHREFVSAGVSAGISAAFGAPIGGVLFSMEEACSFWSRKTAWRCFLCAVLATFTIQLVNQSAQHGMIAFTNLSSMDNKDWLIQLPFILFNAAISGLLGASFNTCRMWLWKVRAAKTRHIQRIIEVVALVFFCSLCGFFFSWSIGKCLPKPKVFGEEYGFQFQCPQGYHNDMASLLLSNQHDTIIQLFSMGHENPELDDYSVTYVESFSKSSLVVFVIIYLIEMSIGAGLAIPGGLFMPSIILGAAWGGLWGLAVRTWLTDSYWNIQPGLYAIMAATGCLGGVFHSAISLVVLIVEGSRGIDFLFGVILSVVVANFVAHQVHHDGVYESELERIGNVYMLRDEPPHRLQTLTTEAIMATGVYGLRAIENVGHIIDVLRTTSHNGFPVFTAEVDNERGADASERLEGLILRSQMLVLLQHRHFCDQNGIPIGREYDPKEEIELETEMRTFFRKYFTHNRYMSATAQPLDSLQLDVTEGTGASARYIDINNLYLDLRPFMNRAPFTVRKDCSAARAHQAFVSLNLRHLLVVDADNKVVGIVTRKDLDHAAGHGWWRVSHMAQPPRNKLVARLAGAGERVINTPLVSFITKMVQGATNSITNSGSGNSNHFGTVSSSYHNGSSNHASSQRPPLRSYTSFGGDEETMVLRTAEDGEEGNVHH